MKTLLAILIVLLARPEASWARPFETQAQVEARLGARICNGAEAPEYKLIAYNHGESVVWVMYMEGISVGELYLRSGLMSDMEVAGLLDASKAQSTWQLEKMQGSSKEVTLKAWSRKDGNLYAMLGVASAQTFFMIGTKKAERIIGDMTKLESRLKPKDKFQ